jgi:UDP-N-acetylmuramoyl-tripeptide--D-alanyl-D-alanine ligase
MGSDTELAIIEMGANHPGEIRLLCDIAQPDFGLITNIGKAHLEGFGGIQGVARGKGELFQFLTGNDKTIFLNEGNPYLTPLIPADYSKVIRYNGDHGLRILQMTSDPLLSLIASNGKDTLEITTNLAGSYNAENVLAACCVGIHCGIITENSVKAIQTYQPQNNRSQLIKTASNTVFMDAYNANPSSMSAAIGEFLQLKAPRKMLILGEMREVGASAEKEHQEIIELLQQQNVKNVICVGKAFDTFAEKAGYQHFASVEILCQTLKAKPLAGYFIFVKGSRSYHLEKVIPLL